MRIVRLIVFSLAFVGLTAGSVSAVASSDLSNSYKTSSSITSGSLVSLDPSRSGYVVPADDKSNQNLVGVAISEDQSLIAANVNAGNIQVAQGGLVNTLVSTLNGSIAVGDQIGVSPISGVGIKALPNTKIIGVAQEPFQYSSANASYTSVTSNSGQKTVVAVGYIPVVIGIGTSESNEVGISPSNPLEKLATSVAGKPVPLTQLVVSSIIIFVTIIAVIVLIYGTIRGSLLSVGRNPLAKPAIFESLAQVIGMICLIVVIAIISVYLILR